MKTLKHENNVSKIHKGMVFAKENWFITIFVLIILFVGFVSIVKYATSEDLYVYAKVKVSQGLWWASTQKPPLWYAKSLQKGAVEKSLSGKPSTVIQSVRYYPWSQSDQYDVYMMVKLKVTGNPKRGTYSFKRSNLAVSSPIDLEFPFALVSGTVINMSDKPITSSLVDKTVTLKKPLAYTWEKDAIQKGDTYFDGEEVVAEILDVSGTSSSVLSRDRAGNVTGQMEGRNDLTVKVKLKGREEDGKFIFGEEQVVIPGASLRLATDNFVFSGFTVAKVEQ